MRNGPSWRRTSPANRGRPRDWTFRELINGIFYVLRGGIPWRLMPTDLPPWPTVYRWFAAWRDDGLFETINHALVMSDRERVGREASPSAAIIDARAIDCRTRSRLDECHAAHAQRGRSAGPTESLFRNS